MGEILRDCSGKRIGEIVVQGNRQVIRDASGRRLGEFDGKFTRDASGKMIGEGNLLTSLLKFY